MGRIISGVDFITVSTRTSTRPATSTRTCSASRSRRGGAACRPGVRDGQPDDRDDAIRAFGVGHSTTISPIEFHVDDFEGANAELESWGVKFKGEPIDSGVCLRTFFEDPDGNA